MGNTNVGGTDQVTGAHADEPHRTDEAVLAALEELGRAAASASEEASSIGAALDVIRTKLESLQRSEARFRALVHLGSEIVFVVHADGTVGFVSPAVLKALGRTVEEVEQLGTLEELVHPDDAHLFRQALKFTANLALGAEVELRMQHADGQWLWFSTTVTDLRNTPGVDGYVIEARDVSERRASLEDLTRRATTDELTGLPNRGALMDALEERVAAEADEPVGFAVLFCDLDGFKAVNDEHGHDVGDAVLREVARRLRKVVRPGDVVGRYGGDEIVVVCDGARTIPAAAAVARRLIGSLDDEVVVDGAHMCVGMSIGIALSSGAATDATQLIRLADGAMFEAKRAAEGADRFAFALNPLERSSNPAST